MIWHILAESSDSGDSAAGAGFAVIFLVIGVISFVLYWVPSLIAFYRSVPNKWSVAVINFLLGWTLIGWAVALSMSVRDKPQPQGRWVPYN